MQHPALRRQTELAERLRARRSELEQATLARIHAISAPPAEADAIYLEGLRTAVSAAVDYGLRAIESAGDRTIPIPVALLAQARLAARNDVGLDTVFRRYVAGHALFMDSVVGEADSVGVRPIQVKLCLRSLAIHFDLLLNSVSEEYSRDADSRCSNVEQRRAAQIRSLLAGELVDKSELGYSFGTYHLGLVAAGAGGVEALRALARPHDCGFLVVACEDQRTWAWLGTQRRLDASRLDLDGLSLPADTSIAVGEPGEGLAGWRLSHRQAAAALPVAQRGNRAVVRYADVALVASLIRDDLLTTSLRQLYLQPLDAGKDHGETARETLRAYIASGRQISSAAAALGVNRHTVASRLRSAEDRLGRTLDTCIADLEAALFLQEMDRLPTRSAPSSVE